MGARSQRSFDGRSGRNRKKHFLRGRTAGEANVAFFSWQESEFMEMLVGVGASRVRRSFQNTAKKAQPAIIFIDEVDAIGRQRGYGTYGWA